ncbi:MAG: Gfo/Idh/MocA family protein [Armatimonadota bacterium]
MADEVSQEPVRVGVIGCGGIAQSAHLPSIGRSEDAQLVAVADADADLAAEVGRRRGLDADSCYGDHKRLLERDDIEAVVICVWTPLHAELSIDALGAGKHVLVEKPMANSTAEAEQMVAAAQQADRILMISYNHSYDLAAERVKDLVTGGEMGDLQYGELFFYADSGAWHAGAYSKVLRSPHSGRHWRKRPADARERTLNYVQNIHSHTINLMRVLIGEPTAVEYCTQVEGAGLWAMFDYGTFKVYLKNVLSRQWIFEKGIELVGTRKRVRLDMAPPTQRYSSGKLRIIDMEADTDSRLLLPDQWPFQREYEHFVTCVREGTEPMTSGAFSVRDVTLAEQIADMAHAG